MKIRFYPILIFLLGALSLNAQDIHFSQFYLAPLTINPALTGSFNGLYRVGVIYREQYFAGGDVKPYRTPSASVDFSLLKEKIKHGALGVGVVFINDQSNRKTIVQNQFLASVAYHLMFGKDRTKFQLGLGFQGGVKMLRVNYDNMRFEQGFNPDLSYNSANSGESFENQSRTQGIFNAGLFTQLELIKGYRFYTGYSFNNIARQKDKFLSSSSDDITRRGFRHLIHGGFEFDIKDAAVLIPGYFFQTQQKAVETNVGLTAGIHVIKKPENRATLFLGLWHRVGESIIPKIGFEYKGFRAGVAYDAMVGKISKDQKNIAGRGLHSIEISLIYVGSISVPKENNYLFNPRY
jgi:type IX secretion system PorP/SprF family membrane protein